MNRHERAWILAASSSSALLIEGGVIDPPLVERWTATSLSRWALLTVTCFCFISALICREWIIGLCAKSSTYCPYPLKHGIYGGTLYLLIVSRVFWNFEQFTASWDIGNRICPSMISLNVCFVTMLSNCKTMSVFIIRLLLCASVPQKFWFWFWWVQNCRSIF